MKPISKQQISKIHVLLQQMDLMDEKKEFIYQFSNNRVTSTKDMTMEEASTLLQHLSKVDPLDGMRKKVFALAYNAGIIYGETPDDKKMNTAKLTLFLKERGTVKKRLNEMNKAELTATVRQFQQIIKNNEFTTAGKITKNLLSELNLSVTRNAQSTN